MTISEKIGRVRLINKFIVPIEIEKFEAPYSIEFFWQIKVY